MKFSATFALLSALPEISPPSLYPGVLPRAITLMFEDESSMSPGVIVNVFVLSFAFPPLSAVVAKVTALSASSIKIPKESTGAPCPVALSFQTTAASSSMTSSRSVVNFRIPLKSLP